MSEDNLKTPRAMGHVQELDIDGMLFPWRNEQPVLLNNTGSPLYHLPLFDSLEDLKVMMEMIEAPFDSIKVLQDSPEFLSSVPPEIVVITNPHFTEQGSVKYLQVQRPPVP